MGCFSSTSKSSTKTSTKTPDSIKDLEKVLAPAAIDVSETPYEAYSGDRVAGFNNDQNTGFDMLRSLVGDAPDVTAEAMSGVKNYMNAPGQSVSTERIVDEDGRLGAISDYMNPYQNQVIDPAIQKIMDATFNRKKGLDAQQHNAGAFGDARHGIQEGSLFNDAQESIGNVSGQLLASGYDNAMAQRQSDLQNFQNVDMSNANYNEAALGRQFQGANAMPGVASAAFGANMDQINALLGAGQQQQQNEQSNLDAGYENFLREQEHPYRSIDALIGAIGGIPTARETTTTTTQPNNSASGAIGAILGGLF